METFIKNITLKDSLLVNQQKEPLFSNVSESPVMSGLSEKKKLFTNTSEGSLYVKIMKDRCYLIWDKDEMLRLGFYAMEFQEEVIYTSYAIENYVFLHYIWYYACTLQRTQNSLGKIKLSTSCWQCGKLSSLYSSLSEHLSVPCAQSSASPRAHTPVWRNAD